MDDRRGTPLRAALDRVAGKARRHLRTSTLLLCLVALMAVGSSLYLQRQSAANNRNFDDNPSVHLITVAGRQLGSSLEPLTPVDIPDIASAVSSTPSTRVTGRYSTGIGMELDSQPIQIIGIDADFAPQLGLATMRDDTLYTTVGTKGSATLKIPVVTESNSAGASSDRMVSRTMSRDPSVDAARVEFLDGPSTTLAYVTTATFWKLAGTMFSGNQSTLIKRASNGELPMTSLVPSAYVLVDNLSQVRAAARSLSERGYAVSYALQAFDDVEGSLRRQSQIGWGVLGLLTLAASTYFVVSWRDFMRLSRRDVGTLKHWHVPVPAIRGIYRRRVHRSGAIVLAVTTLTNALAGWALLGPVDAARSTAWLLLCAVPAIAVLCVVVDHWVIAPVTRSPALELLKQGREFQ